MLHVVAAAIVRDGLVLAARRRRPPELAGGWEFPGGKVEPGEAPRAALARECTEELGVAVTVGDRMAEVRDGRIRLELYRATLLDGEPAARHDHDELRWLRPAALATLDWLPLDRPLLAAVAAVLADPAAAADTKE